MRTYDDENELMGYVWRNYPEIVRPLECVASAERVRDALPPSLRDELLGARDRMSPTGRRVARTRSKGVE